MPLNLSNPERSVRVGVVLMSGVTEILDVAPIDLIHGMSKSFLGDMPETIIPSTAKQHMMDMEFIWVSEAGPSGHNKLTSGLRIVPTHSFRDCPPLDVAIIGAHNYGYEPNNAELDFVRKTYASCAAFITVCGGIEVALRAGILFGKTATGPRFLLDVMKKQAPDVNWVEHRWVRDGTLWTSGALLNGLDLTAAFMEEVWGENKKELVQWLSQSGSFVSRDLHYTDGNQQCAFGTKPCS